MSGAAACLVPIALFAGGAGRKAVGSDVNPSRTEGHVEVTSLARGTPGDALLGPMLVNDLDVPVVTGDTDLLRHLWIDPTKTYQPRGDLRSSGMSRGDRPPCRATRQGARSEGFEPPTF